jgi:hypothetical protein
MNEYTISAGGPIIKNKTFFYALYDQQFSKMRADMNLMALTPCARRGVFRFYDNWSNGNALQLTTTGTTPRYASVDRRTMPPRLLRTSNGHNAICVRQRLGA